MIDDTPFDVAQYYSQLPTVDLSDELGAFVRMATRQHAAFATVPNWVDQHINFLLSEIESRMQ